MRGLSSAPAAAAAGVVLPAGAAAAVPSGKAPPGGGLRRYIEVGGTAGFWGEMFPIQQGLWYKSWDDVLHMPNPRYYSVTTESDGPCESDARQLDYDITKLSTCGRNNTVGGPRNP